MMTETAALPSLFLPHGAPTFALHPGRAGAVMSELAAHIPRPRALIVVSAHWETDKPCVGFAEQPATIHDFWGFPAELYAIRYPAPGDAHIAGEVLARLRAAGFEAGVDLHRGLDHGAWTPLRFMYPDADVPIVPLSVQPRLGPRHHFAVGRALEPMTREGVLVLASGNLTHNLRDAMRSSVDGDAPAYVRAFSDWVWARLHEGDVDALLDYRHLAPGAELAHPRDEHLLPLFVALGAHASGRVERIHAGIDYNAIAMDAFVFYPEEAA